MERANTQQSSVRGPSVAPRLQRALRRTTTERQRKGHSSPLDPTRKSLLGPSAVSADTSHDAAVQSKSSEAIGFQGVHHVGLLCENLETSLEFYQGLLGLEINPDRPDKKLPYRGAWLWIGAEMIHLMELPNPDPMDGRPNHGGRDRHFCIGIKNIQPLIQALDNASVEYTMSMSGRKAVFFRDPDMNCLECVELAAWR